MRRFISILSAAALAASVVVVPVTAGAADAVYSYDGGDVSTWTTGDSHLLITSETDDMGSYAKITTDGNGTYSTTLTLPAEAQLSDNYVIEYDVMVHQSNGMQRFARYNQVAFISADAAHDTRDFSEYAAAYNAAFGSGGNTASETGVGYTTGVASSVTSIWGMASAQINAGNDTVLELSTDESGIVGDKWYRMQAAISGDVATVTVIDSENNKIVDAAEYPNTASQLSKIFITVGRGDAGVSGGGIVALDNIKIYEGTAETLTTEGLRGEVVATPEPTAEPTPEPIEYEKAVEYDFDNTAAEVTVGRSFSPDVVDGTDDANTTKVLAVTSSSTNSGDTRFGYAYIDLSSYTAGKSQIKIEYDAYISEGGRMIYSVAETLPETYSSAGIFKQGYAGNSPTNISGNTWVHTNVEVDLLTGKGTYKVTNGDTTVASGTTNDASDVKYILFISWTEKTSYIDNIVVSTAGSREIVTPTPSPTPAPTASPEPASTVEGSNLTLAPDSARDIKTFSKAEGAPTAVLNHSAAKPAVAADVDAFSENAKGNAVYAIYDVLVNAGDVLTLKAQGSSDLGTTFVLTGNEDGTASASALVNKGDTVNIKGNLVCGTWYRVKLELPQSASGTGNARYTIYRINPKDPTKTAGIVAEGKELTPRNLASKQMTRFTVEATGTPYIDNGVTYIDTASADTWYRYGYTKDADGVLTNITIEKVDPTKNGPQKGYFVWNTYMVPYVAPAEEETPAE